VGVEQVGPVVAVSGQVDPTYPIGRKTGEVVRGPEAAIHGADEDVDVEQDAAVRLLGDGERNAHSGIVEWRKAT
jgi:hypothetical protein